MTEAEFETMIADAKARLAQALDAAVDDARRQTRSDFNESYLKLLHRFEAAARDFGVKLPDDMPPCLSEFSATPGKGRTLSVVREEPCP